MALLQVLAERPHTTAKREELLDRIWPDGDGSDESLTRLVYMLRKSFAETHDLRDIIKTVSKQGYLLVADVEREALSSSRASAKHLKANDADSSEFIYSLAVLPVSEVDETANTSVLRAGLTHDLTTLLSRSTRLNVAPASSTAYFVENLAPYSEIARALNVRYLVSTSLQRAPEDISVRVELIEAENEKLVWSDRINVRLEDFPGLGDEVALRIATAVSTSVKVPIRYGEIDREIFSQDIFERVHLSRSLRANYGPDTAKRIEQLLTEASELSPDSALVKAELAVQLSQNVVSKWTRDEAATRQRANRLIEDALSLRPTDPDVLTSAGIVCTMFHDPVNAIGYLKRALELDPSNAHALAVLGWQKCLKYSDKSGLKDIETAEQRAPHHPRFGLWATYKCTAHLFMLDYEAGESACRDAIVRTPNYYQPHCSLAWALTGLGRQDKAKAAIIQARNFGDKNIVGRFVEEMHAWTSNSPNHLQSKKILDQLLEISAAT